MADKFKYKNVMQIPRLQKIVVSMGLGEAVKDKNIMQDATRELTMLTGQKPLVCNAKKSVANFKLREGYPIGLKVTLRGKRMYDFMDRFCNIVSPRIRDFRGFKKKGDSRGAYSLGLSDQQVFPEIDLDKVKREQGMNITFVTDGQNDDESLALLEMMGMPFTKGEA
ncbi:MAG: 50S ribosomal protein L5 [Chlamydiia bacterium]|nr:50S ribosomal protein L5 [Chlamydiia bacterium]